MLQSLHVDLPSDNGVRPVDSCQDLWVQRPDLADDFSLDDHVELLASEVMGLVRGPELVIAAEPEVALLEDELERAVRLSEKTAIGVLLHFIREDRRQLLAVSRPDVSRGIK